MKTFNSSIIYWLEKKGGFVPNRSRQEPKKIDPTLCEVCGKKKPKNWSETKFCGTKCFDAAGLKRIYPHKSYWQIEQLKLNS
jgi:hypothetical protein